MGIKDLWAILAPLCERKPLYELQGKKVAVDLSGWICESQNITEYTVQPRMYLRNLYFRTCCLLLMDVTPVFVLEGKAPDLKHKTIAARNAIQFKGVQPRKEGVKTGKDRTRFNHTLRQCEEMLGLLGLACVKGCGEAEALCAYLNEEGLVDGVISQDSDCFAYGAQVVYKNFSISQQGAHVAKGGSVDVYDISKAREHLNFGRNKVIALAVLCGSDYSDGVPGIGKDSALKLFNTLTDDQILPRIRSWKLDNRLFQNLECKVNDKNICTSCGHLGRMQNHSKKGCQDCGITAGCDSTRYKSERQNIKTELAMRDKALQDPDFPDERLVDEFLRRKDDVRKLNLEWKKPDLINFIKFTGKFLDWDEIYSFEKFLPILTRWQLVKKDQSVLVPVKIKKKRAPKGVASYEIIWEDPKGLFEDLIFDKNSNLEKLWSTVEPQDLMEKAYPQLVTEFNASKQKQNKGGKKKRVVDEIDGLMKSLSIKKKKKKKTTLDDFVFRLASTPIDKSTIERKSPRKQLEPLELEQKFLDQKSLDMWELEMSNFGDENDMDVSDIVENLIKRDIPKDVKENLENLKVQLNKNLNCSFFVNEYVENDLFEKTFNEYCNLISDSDSE